jgi:flagellar protein FliO/FliZ
MWALATAVSAAGAGTVWAESDHAAGQSRLVPPRRDILGATPVTRPAAASEAQLEIRRPDQPAAGQAAQPVNGPLDSDRRVVNRQVSAGGIGRWGDFVPLLAVLALIAAAAWVVRKYMPARRLISGSGVMEIVARLPLSGRQSLVLVKLGGRLVLVGVTPERIGTVCIVDDPEQVAMLIGRAAGRGHEPAGAVFGGSLDRELGAFEEDPEAEVPLGAVGPVRGLIEKVRRLGQSRVA